MPTNLRDLLDVTSPYQTGVIPFWDGCNWIAIQIPAGITCQDVQSCIDCTFIAGLFDFTDPSLIFDPLLCSMAVNPTWVNQNIISSFDCVTGDLVIGYTTYNLSCLADFFDFNFTDGQTSQVVHNHNTVTLNWRDGLGFWLGNGGLNISLPNPRLDGQVLTWSDNLNQAYRANRADVCCDRVYDCMEPIIASLQNQINILATQLCPCGWTGTPLAVYEEGLLVHWAVSMINFIGDCLTATWNMGTGQVDVTLAVVPTWSGCQGMTPYILSICGTDIDLSCLADSAFNLIIQEEGVEVSQNVTTLNFIGDCLTATQSLTPGVVDVSLDIGLARSTCDDSGGNIPYILTVCGQTVDLSCLANPIPYTLYIWRRSNGKCN